MEEKTKLLQIVEQKTEQIRNAIEQAIDEGAIIKDIGGFFMTIDDVFLQKDRNGNFAVVLRFESKKIAKLFDPSKDELVKLAEEKRAELEEIEKKINEYETDND